MASQTNPKWVNLLATTPLARDFATTSGLGTPININKLTGQGFYLDGGIVKPLGGMFILNVRDFGAVGDDVTNDGPAFIAALAYSYSLLQTGTGFGAAGPSIFVPFGKYYLGTNTIDITHTVELFGEGGTTFGAASQLRWDDGVTGIRFQGNDTTGDTGTGVQIYPGAYGSRLRNLFLKGAYSGTESEHHGILMRARAHLNDIFIEGFSGDGLVVFAGSPNGGNCNGWSADRIWTYSNRDGVRATGADANIGTCRSLITTWNRRWGIWDNSFLGSIWEGQSEINGRVSLGSLPSMVHYSSNWYAVVVGQEVGASTNAPSGTTANNTWWYWCTAGASNPGVPDWISGITVRAGGAAHTDGASAPTVFINFWAETAQGPLQLVSPTQVVGGNQPAGVKGISVLTQQGGTLTAQKLRASQVFSAGPTDGPDPLTDGNIFLENKLNNFTVYFRRWTAPGVATVDASLIGNVNGLQITGNPGILFFPNGTYVGIVNSTGLDLDGGGKVYKINGAQVVGASHPNHIEAATSSASYAAPGGGTTIDTQCRASLAQLAADLADMKAKLQAATLMT